MASLRRLLTRRRTRPVPVPVLPGEAEPDALDDLAPPAGMVVALPLPATDAPATGQPAPVSEHGAGKKPSGSQSRQRQKKIYTRVTDEEHAAVLAKAAAAGLSVGGYGRTCMLGAPTPRTKHKAPVDHAVYADAIGALNRTGNNLNQIAKALNRDDLVTPEALKAALCLYADALNRLMHAVTGAANDR